MYTVWSRVVGSDGEKTEWQTSNVTETNVEVELQWSTTYEFMITAWNKNGQSFTDPQKAARITVGPGIVHI